ncbi:lactosylceramide 1,3-N-acetyl-beta-D-glucosaminyltransferase-like [Palaemon carinicauda]|uniref:lactosylceramide 1,3-N-acetyl-beta-D-glucosaminyltransferase-like n=1 Tax=Palaemon carinicauda TaxID=392227 RepID=UPI0035B69AA3
MMVPNRRQLRLAEILALCVLCSFFGFYIGITSEEISMMKSQSLNSVNLYAINWAESSGKEGDNLNRLVTARPSNDSQVNHESWLPMGPDETVPGRPAIIPTVFPIEESDFCRKRPGLDIIAYVHSSISRVSSRNTTRNTWANASAYNLGVNIGTVFMVGRPKNEEERRMVQEESDRYHDIVQGDYADHYRLLSYKGLASLYWINKHCSHVNWTMHADDDVHLDIFLYWQKIKALSEANKEKFICSYMRGPALRYGRWYVSYAQYPKLNYPMYCSGGLWFLQTKKLPLLLEASKKVPFLWVDDAYLTGIVADKAKVARHPFQEFYGHPKPTLEEIGKKVAWFYLRQSRLEVWDKMVKYHKEQNANPLNIPKNINKENQHNDSPMKLFKLEVKKLLDGVEVKKMPDGVEDKKMVDGVEVKKMPDGVEDKKMLDGVEVKKMPDGVEIKNMLDSVNGTGDKKFKIIS